MWRNYLFPGSVEEVLETLAAYDGRARLIAGGTDLILELQEGKRQVEVLVDITRIPSLNAIELDEGMITLGAAATYRQVIDSPILQAKATVLVEASQAVGSPQIRNVGTLVGNVVNAMPAADGAIALFALGAELEIASPRLNILSTGAVSVPPPPTIPRPASVSRISPTATSRRSPWWRWTQRQGRWTCSRCGPPTTWAGR